MYTLLYFLGAAAMALFPCGIGGQDVAQVCTLCSCKYLQSAHLSEAVCTADHSVLEVNCASKPKVKQNPNQFLTAPSAKNNSIIVWLSYKSGGLTSTPSFVQFQPFNVTTLSLDFNRLVYIPSGALIPLQNLSIFSATHNDISFVAPDAFKGLQHLRYIDLSSNSMHTLDFSLFLDSVKLVSLDVHNNSIKNINGPPLHTQIKTLEILDVSANKILNFPLVLFSSFPHMLRLNISHNLLGVLAADFEDLTLLKVFDASGNQVKSVDKRIVDNLKNLERLYLRENLLTSVDYVETIPSLSLLDVSQNNISFLGDRLLSSRLQRLVVSHNNLTDLSHIFKVFDQLKSLDASWNPCSEFPDNVRAGLQELILDGSFVSSWPAQRLGGGRIDHFSLSHAPNITALGPHAFSGILKPKNASGKCVSLKISNTSLSLIDEDAFKDIDICKLDLSHNKLRWLPESLIAWESLVGADLQDNPWHCDCALQWMLTSVVPSAYRADQALLENLRCASPPELAGLRLVHWYQHSEASLCGPSQKDAMLTAKARSRLRSEDSTDRLLVTISSSPLMIAVLLCLSVVAVMLVILGFALQRRAIRQRNMRRNRRF